VGPCVASLLDRVREAHEKPGHERVADRQQEDEGRGQVEGHQAGARCEHFEQPGSRHLGIEVERRWKRSRGKGEEVHRVPRF
jgi:hypothetical protein